MIQLEMLKLLKDRSSELKALKSNRNHNHTERKGINQNTASNNTRKKRMRVDTRKYYWSHGAFNHTSKECGARKNGHKEDASFNNEVGGSCVACPE